MARDVPSWHVGQGQLESIGSRSLACLLRPNEIDDGSQSVVMRDSYWAYVRRLRGPLCVNATPKRAVRVGNTQSA